MFRLLAAGQKVDTSDKMSIVKAQNQAFPDITNRGYRQIVLFMPIKKEAAGLPPLVGLSIILSLLALVNLHQMGYSLSMV